MQRDGHLRSWRQSFPRGGCKAAGVGRYFPVLPGGELLGAGLHPFLKAIDEE